MEEMDHQEIFGDHEGVNGFEKGSASERSSICGDPLTPNESENNSDSPESPGKSTVSSSSDDSEEYDTDVLLSTESVQVMAETVGIELGEEACTYLADHVMNKLRRVTLLALQFSRHGHATGLRATDFTKAEKTDDASFSMGYGFTHKLPEYLDFGDFCTEFGGSDVELSRILNTAAVNEVTVNENVDPVLKSRFIHYHDKLTKDSCEDTLYPDFHNLLKDSNFHLCSNEDWDYREEASAIYTNGETNGFSDGGQSPQIMPDFMEIPENLSENYPQISNPSSSDRTPKKFKQDVGNSEHMDVDAGVTSCSRNESGSDSRRPDIYMSGEFLRNQNDLGDNIFSEEDVNEEVAAASAASQQCELSNHKKSSVRAATVVSPDITETRSSKRPPQYPPKHSQSFGRKSSEGEIGSTEGGQVNSSDESSSSSDDSGPEDYQSNDVDDDFEVVIDPEPELVEPELSDTDGEDLSDEEDDNEIVHTNAELPVEWGIYLKHFLVAFYDTEKPYETFEKQSYNYYLDEEEDEDLPVLTDFEIILKDAARNSIYPVFHVIVEFFHNYIGGKYLHIGNKQLRRITTFVQAILLCPVRPKICHLKSMLAPLLDMLTLPVPCKLQQCNAASIMQIADSCPGPLNLQLIRWTTCFISKILHRVSRMSRQQLTAHVKSRLCGAIHLALEYESRSIRPQKMHEWMKNVLLVSHNLFIANQRPPHLREAKSVIPDNTDSYVEEAIMKFIYSYKKTYWKTHPDGELKPLLDKNLEFYGEKLSFLFCQPQYLHVTPGNHERRLTRKGAALKRLEEEKKNVVYNEFIVRRGIVDCKEQTKIQIPFALCVL